ncbi:MAG: hypothetical protein ACE5IC_06290 [Candidatus Brocadiales bacterium]
MLYRLYDILKSKKLGILAGFATTGLLIFGSLLMNFMPEYYRGLAGEDINFFFEHVGLINGWFYLLFAAFVVYGINAFFCTFDSVLIKLRAGVRNITLYGGSVVHLAFMVTLVAHLVGGLGASHSRPVVIGEKPVEYGGVELRLAGLETSTYPNGMPREVRATIKMRRGEEEFERTLGYNQPVLLDLGAKEFLLKQYGSSPQGVILKVNGRPQELKMQEEFSLGDSRAVLAGLLLPPRVKMPVMAIVTDSGGKDAKQFFIPMGKPYAQTIGNVQVQFEDVKVSNTVVVDLKENPSVPLALGATLLFAVGAVMVVFRLVQKLTHKY